MTYRSTSRARSKNRPARRRRRRPIALTGTPGTGKSRVARLLARELSVIEVGDLALRSGTGRRQGRGVSVDLRALQRAFPRVDAEHPHDVYVGHLAQLLPLHDIVVLRCRPVELGKRLARARRGTLRDRHENIAAEALDVVLWESVGPGRRVWEVDTTGQSPAAVAREVRRRWRVRGPSSVGTVRWLADSRVTDYLLETTP